MLKIVYFVALLVPMQCSLGNTLQKINGPKSGKIFGGKLDDITRHPWQVLVGMNTPSRQLTWCGGSIIGAKWVLTAGHCLKIEDEKTHKILRLTHVWSGSDYRGDGTVHAIDYLVLHEGYSDDTVLHDIALVHVSQRFEWNAFTKRIQIYSGSERNIRRHRVTASGFGKLEESGEVSLDLRSVKLTLADRKTCNKVGGYHKSFHGVFCTVNSHKGTCQGDSGGPVTVNIRSKNFLIGIVSSGSDICGRKYNEFTNVAYYADWIRNHTINK